MKIEFKNSSVSKMPFISMFQNSRKVKIFPLNFPLQNSKEKLDFELDCITKDIFKSHFSFSIISRKLNCQVLLQFKEHLFTRSS